MEGKDAKFGLIVQPNQTKQAFFIWKPSDGTERTDGTISKNQAWSMGKKLLHPKR